MMTKLEREVWRATYAAQFGHTSIQGTAGKVAGEIACTIATRAVEQLRLRCIDTPDAREAMMGDET